MMQYFCARLEMRYVKMKQFYFGSNSERRKLSSEGKIKKLYTGVYTSINDDTELKKVLQTQWPLIAANAFKNSVISYRTAIEFKPSPKGYIFLISKQAKTVSIGGISFKLIRGNPENSTNRKALMGALTASLEKAFLDCLTLPKTSPSDDRYFPISELEDRLENIMKQQGEEALNQFRDKAKMIAEESGSSSSFKRLNDIIAALLGSRKMDLHGRNAIARSKGLPVDSNRMDLFFSLASHLETLYYPEEKDKHLRDSEHFENKAFFESYFSNYIEGTTFLIEEAEQIIFDKEEIPNRPADSHDISGTFSVLSDRSFMQSTPDTENAFIEQLCFINKSIIPTRSDMKPGKFKTMSNRAGNTVFVHPDDVEGTLMEAFRLSQSLSHPIARGIFLSYAVSEVHPFNDGNGRTCRIVLNRELLSHEIPSIIIPTVFREDYLLSLRALSRKKRPAPIGNMFLRALQFSCLDFREYQGIKQELIDRNWFLEPDEGKIIDK